MKFWDASAVILLFLEEPETPRMLEIARLEEEWSPGGARSLSAAPPSPVCVGRRS
jgi:hypothetical protein